MEKRTARDALASVGTVVLIVGLLTAVTSTAAGAESVSADEETEIGSDRVPLPGANPCYVRPVPPIQVDLEDLNNCADLLIDQIQSVADCATHKDCYICPTDNICFQI